MLVPLLLVFALIAFLGWTPMIFDLNMRDSDKPIAGWITTGIALFVCGITLLFQWPSTKTFDARVKFEAPTYREGLPPNWRNEGWPLRTETCE